MTVTAAAAAPTHAIGGRVGGVPPYIWTACTNAACPAYRVRRQVWLKQVAVGVVALPGTLLCAACTHALPYSVHSPLDETEEELVPKIHNGRPPTDKHDIPAPEPVKAPAVPDTVRVELNIPDADDHFAELMRQVVAGQDGGSTAEAADTNDATVADEATSVDAASGTANDKATSAQKQPEEPGEKPKRAPRKAGGRKAGGKS